MQVKTDAMLLFWLADSVFSNWYQPAEFTLQHLDGTMRHFKNSEAAFIYNKAMFFGDTAVASMIYANQDPKTAKAMGKLVKGFDEERWTMYRQMMMHDACFAKFDQNEKLKKILLDTGDRILVEASPYDKIWGIGLKPNDPLALDKKNWKGLNLLGEVLMSVRSELL